jgi:nucleoside-diphosphate-sugar epimerase
LSVLVTGATGLVGAETLDQLRAAGEEAVGTSRRGGEEAVAWDMAAEPPPPELCREWDAIVHTAADTRWTLPIEEAKRANVDTVEALLELVGPETHLVHVSTAFAAGLRGDGSSPDPADYRNTYEWSKACAERLVRERVERATIVRVPLIVGRRGDGRAARYAGMYTILRGMATSTVPAVVAEPDAFLDVIPVDDLGSLLRRQLLAGPAPATVTLACGEAAPRVEATIGLLTGALNGWRDERGLPGFEVPRLMAPDSWHRFFLPFARDHLSPRQLRVLELLSNFEPYMVLRQPLRPTHRVRAVEPALVTSVRSWAGKHPQLASMSPRPWAGPGDA